MTVAITPSQTGLPADSEAGRRHAGAQEPSTPTDAALMARVGAGDREAFGELVDRYKDDLVAYLSRLTRSRERAEDLAQETFLRLFRAAPRYRDRGRLAAYVYRIATNLLRSEERRERRWRALSPILGVQIETRTEPGAPRRMMESELRQRLAAAIASLPLTLRSPLVLFEIEDWSQQEIAHVLGCRVGTVKSRIHRARARLRKELGPFWTEWNGESP